MVAAIIMPRKIGIIGYGEFGRFVETLVHQLAPDASVLIASRSHAPDGARFGTLEEVCAADVVCVCVPIAAFEETIERILPLLAPHTVVCDVATVKEHTVSVLRKKGVPRFIAAHPMFGPYSYEKHNHSVSGLRIALCDSTLTGEETSGIILWLRGCGFVVLELSAESHDRQLAETLFVTHLVGQTMKRGEFVRTTIDTVSFGFLMDAVESVSHDDALFRDVYRFNPYCRDVLERFEEAEKYIAASLRSA